MRWLSRVVVLLAWTAIGCGGGSPVDAGTDTAAVDSGSDVPFTGGPLCTDYARECMTPTPYGTCCSMCPVGYTCGIADPGVDAGAGTMITTMCSATCSNASECPGFATMQVSCVRGLCYQQCDPVNAASCPALEECTSIFGVHICTVVTCH